MWMSKVKKYLISIDTGFALKATFVFSMCCICLVFSFAVINGAMEILGLNSKSDAIALFSGLATALTLMFFVYQHNVNESKKYQLVMVEEAKLAVDKMILNAKKLYEWDGKKVSILNNILIELSNHAIDFETFYDKINDPALKKIVEIRWQDMFLNHYRGISEHIDVSEIFRRNTDAVDSEFEIRLVFLNDEFDGDKQNEKYEFERYRISRASEFNLYDISRYLVNQEQFKHHFMNENQVIKYLEEVGYEDNQRETYPTLCAIVDTSIE
ncbi:TPA: hypothetical protein RQM97_001570 [Aeromonas dhakensis]|nr:hypothetical protein [Aeromonas dhakensis]HDX8353612.1 hypothetical protein [Aeromonas dhakensis]